MDRAVVIANDLTATLRALQTAPAPNMGRHGESLKRLADIFENVTNELEKTARKTYTNIVHPYGPKKTSRSTTSTSAEYTKQHTRTAPHPLTYFRGCAQAAKFCGERPNSEGERPNSEGEKQPTLHNNNKPAPPQI
eukprot:scaffold125012_cov24-Attheya_sp.AAC.1